MTHAELTAIYLDMHDVFQRANFQSDWDLSDQALELMLDAQHQLDEIEFWTF